MTTAAIAPEAPPVLDDAPAAEQDKKAAPKKGGKSVETRLKDLEASHKELTWYVAELLTFISNAIADNVAAQAAQQNQVKLQQDLREQARTVGLSGLAGLSIPT